MQLKYTASIWHLESICILTLYGVEAHVVTQNQCKSWTKKGWIKYIEPKTSTSFQINDGVCQPWIDKLRQKLKKRISSSKGRKRLNPNAAEKQTSWYHWCFYNHCMLFRQRCSSLIAIRDSFDPIAWQTRNKGNLVLKHVVKQQTLVWHLPTWGLKAIRIDKLSRPTLPIPIGKEMQRRKTYVS